MNIRYFTLVVCLSVSACMTPEERAAYEQQQAALRHQQEQQFREQLISTCAQYGYKRGTPQNRECVARSGQELVVRQQQEDQRKAAWWACMGRVNGSYGNAAAICNQNPNYMPPPQQQIIMSPPVINAPVNTRCMPIPGGGMNCQSF